MIKSKTEVTDFIKKTLIDQYGENLLTSEKEDTIEWNFDGGNHMCSLVYIGNKYELKIDRNSICGTIDRFDQEELLRKTEKIRAAGSLKFLEPSLKGHNIGEIWKSKGGSKFRLEFDAETGEVSWVIKTKEGEKIICVKGKLLTES